MEPISYGNYFLHTNNVNIALTETCLHPNTKLNFSNYDIIWYDSSQVIADGLAIIINSIKYTFFRSLIVMNVKY